MPRQQRSCSGEQEAARGAITNEVEDEQVSRDGEEVLLSYRLRPRADVSLSLDIGVKAFRLQHV